MRPDKTIERPGNGKLTRRRMFKVLALAGVGVAPCPLLSSAVAATIKMQAAIMFEPHIPTALRLALNYAGDVLPLFLHRSGPH